MSFSYVFGRIASVANVPRPAQRKMETTSIEIVSFSLQLKFKNSAKWDETFVWFLAKVI